jgi:hypothetical protein
MQSSPRIRGFRGFIILLLRQPIEFENRSVKAIVSRLVVENETLPGSGQSGKAFPSIYLHLLHVGAQRAA